MAAGLLAWSGARLDVTLRAMRGLLLMAVLLGAWTVWQSGWPRSVEVVGDLVALLLLATTLTVTTPVDEVMDAVVHGLRPLRPLGVDPEQVGLTFSLMLRAIPSTLTLARETRDAALARGLERYPRARLSPWSSAWSLAPARPATRCTRAASATTDPGRVVRAAG